MLGNIVLSWLMLIGFVLASQNPGLKLFYLHEGTISNLDELTQN